MCGVINRWVSANRAVLVALSKCKRQDEDLPKPPALGCAVKGPRRAMRPDDRLIKAKGSLDRSDCRSTWATARRARFWSHYPLATAVAAAARPGPCGMSKACNPASITARAPSVICALT